MKRIILFMCFLITFSCGSKKTVTNHEVVKVENKDIQEIEVNKDIESVILSVLDKYTYSVTEANDSLVSASNGDVVKYGNKVTTEVNREIKTDEKKDSHVIVEKAAIDKGSIVEVEKSDTKTNIKRGGFYKTIGVLGMAILIFSIVFYRIKKK